MDPCIIIREKRSSLARLQGGGGWAGVIPVKVDVLARPTLTKRDGV